MKMKRTLKRASQGGEGRGVKTSIWTSPHLWSSSQCAPARAPFTKHPLDDEEEKGKGGGGAKHGVDDDYGS